jgi:hypothetical protein
MQIANQFRRESPSASVGILFRKRIVSATVSETPIYLWSGPTDCDKCRPLSLH